MPDTETTPTTPPPADAGVFGFGILPRVMGRVRQEVSDYDALRAAVGSLIKVVGDLQHRVAALEAERKPRRHGKGKSPGRVSKTDADAPAAVEPPTVR